VHPQLLSAFAVIKLRNPDATACVVFDEALQRYQHYEQEFSAHFEHIF
jgi:hypothetical protein